MLFLVSTLFFKFFFLFKGYYNIIFWWWLKRFFMYMYIYIKYENWLNLSIIKNVIVFFFYKIITFFPVIFIFLIYYFLMQTSIFFIWFTVSNNLISLDSLELLIFFLLSFFCLFLTIIFLLVIKYGISIFFIEVVPDSNLINILDISYLNYPKLIKVLCYIFF